MQNFVSSVIFPHRQGNARPFFETGAKIVLVRKPKRESNFFYAHSIAHLSAPYDFLFLLLFLEKYGEFFENACFFHSFMVY